MRGLESSNNFDYWVNMGLLMMVFIHEQFRYFKIVHFMMGIVVWFKVMRNFVMCFIMVWCINVMDHMMRCLMVRWSKVRNF